MPVLRLQSDTFGKSDTFIKILFFFERYAKNCQVSHNTSYLILYIYLTDCRVCNLFWFLSNSDFFLSILASKFASSEATFSNICWVFSMFCSTAFTQPLSPFSISFISSGLLIAFVRISCGCFKLHYTLKYTSNKHFKKQKHFFHCREKSTIRSFQNAIRLPIFCQVTSHNKILLLQMLHQWLFKTNWEDGNWKGWILNTFPAFSLKLYKKGEFLKSIHLISKFGIPSPEFTSPLLQKPVCKLLQIQTLEAVCLRGTMRLLVTDILFQKNEVQA